MERPILFSGEMVKAILAGRKTQTRRLMDDTWLEGRDFVHLKQSLGYPASERYVWAGFQKRGELSPLYVKCPYGKMGHWLWVRESFRFGQAPRDEVEQGVALYADNTHRYHPDLERSRQNWCREWKKRPAIFMPRWASRIMLEITNIRAERLQAITEEDAKAEGVGAWHDTAVGTVYRPEFQMLWDTLNGKKAPWASNPWVWVIEFEYVD